MINTDDPIEQSQNYANVKIAIGGGINELRDALLTSLYGLFTNPDQLAARESEGLWLAPGAVKFWSFGCRGPVSLPVTLN